MVLPWYLGVNRVADHTLELPLATTLWSPAGSGSHRLSFQFLARHVGLLTERINQSGTNDGEVTIAA